MPLHVDFYLLDVCLTVYLGRALPVWGEVHLLGRVEGRMTWLQRREGVVLAGRNVALVQRGVEEFAIGGLHHYGVQAFLVHAEWLL